MRISFILPWCPSTNRYWRSIVIKGQVRVLVSREGQDYQRNVAVAVMEQGVPRGSNSRLQVSIEARPPDRRTRDLDNLLKSTLDAITKAGVWLDDSQIDRLELVRGPVVKDGLLVITVNELSRVEQQMEIAA